MRITITSVMLLCTVVCMGQDNHGEQFFNADGSQNAYFIDTLHIDSLIVVRSKKNGHFFALRNLSEKKLKGNILNSSDTYLYYAESFYGWWLTNMPDDFIPDAIWGTNLNGGVAIQYIHSSLSGQYQIVSNLQKPKYYWLVMIRGDAYNYLTVRCVLDGDRKLLKFKDEKAYYKVLMPVWK